MFELHAGASTRCQPIHKSIDNIFLVTLQIAYFDDPLIRALNYFESLMQMDNNQKMQFFKTLPAILPRFDKVIKLVFGY